MRGASLYPLHFIFIAFLKNIINIEECFTNIYMVHLSSDCTVYPKVLVTVNGFYSRILLLFHNADNVRVYFGGVREQQ